MSDLKRYIEDRAARDSEFAQDVRLSTLRRYADAVGANLRIRLTH